MRAPTHKLRIRVDEALQTVGVCTCGAWRREASLETIAVTGRSREDALRAAHDLHARGLDEPARPHPRE